MKPQSRLTQHSGYSLIEMLVAMAIMTVVTGTIFQLVNPSQATSQIQPEVQDMQQRMRVGTDTIFKDVVMAGAGPYQGPVTGSLNNFFAPIIPRRTGYLNPDPYQSARTDAITLTYIPNSYSQTTISQAMPEPSAELKVNDQPNCPQGQQLCGFTEGEVVIIFDASGHFDTFTITTVQDDAGHLQHRGQDLSYAYDAGASILQVESHTYYLDSANQKLMHYDGGLNAPQPIVDNVVGLRFDYFGDPDPPTQPKPAMGTSNCLYDADGGYVGGMATLATGGGSLAPMPISMFTDGPWCGGGSNLFDADLYRVRKVRITLRVQTPNVLFRGLDTTLFQNPGTAKSGQKYIPDLVTSLEVSPRNLNLSR
jgi:prepilin-type N-terminal cleavage/methylation domain-containing protein